MIMYSDGRVSNGRRIDLEQAIIFLAFGIFISLITIIFGIRLIVQRIDERGYGAVLILLGITLFICVIVQASENFAKYEFCKNGVRTKYPLEKWKLIPWHEFQEVCICYIYTKYGVGESVFVVICCVKNGEKKNKKGRWKAENPFRHRSVIRIDYTKQLHKELEEKCPYKVKDLRNTVAYIFNYKQRKFY